jgi:hypothetical protein
MQEINGSEPKAGKHDPKLICSQLVNAILIYSCCTQIYENYIILKVFSTRLYIKILSSILAILYFNIFAVLCIYL